MEQAILFTSICKPFDKFLGQFSAADQMAFRLTRGQGLFVLYEHTHVYSLHLIAQNISFPSIVLEYPTLDQLCREVERGYKYVAISFKACNADRLLEMCELIRKKSPKSRIVVGGYGAICASELFKDQSFKGMIDNVCFGEGISFLRDLLGETPAHNINCHLPKEGSTLPWVTPRSMGTIGIILSGLGCTYRCPFCTTSAFTGGRYVEVLTAEQIYHAMLSYYEDSPWMNSVTIYDENFLDYKEKVTALGKFLQHDKRFGLRRFNYFTFCSLSSLAKYEPEELLLNGIDTLWIGVESKFSSLAKRRSTKVKDAFQMLHSIGIKTVGSWIIGQDFQSPENINEDIDFFISLDPTFQQASILSIVPGVPLWKKLNRQGRIPSNVSCKDYHLYGHTIIYKHFTHDELLTLLDSVYKEIYFKNGSALMKVLEVNLNGYEWCIKSHHPLLRQGKSQFFRSRCESYYFFLKTARTYAPSSQVRSRLDHLHSRYHEIFGEVDPLQDKIADQILRKADEEIKRRQKEPSPIREEPFRRYTYLSSSQHTSSRPYMVEYPND